MKLKMKLAFFVLPPLFFCLVGVILSQQRTVHRVHDQNRILHQQIEDLNARFAEVAQKNLRLSESPPPRESSAQMEREQFLELLRLRDEVSRLRTYIREAKQAPERQMQAASELPRAEAALELAKAELLAVQAEAERATIAGVQLRKAVVEFARTADLYSKSLIGRAEYEIAAAKLESNRADVQGAVAMVRE